MKRNSSVYAQVFFGLIMLSGGAILAAADTAFSDGAAGQDRAVVVRAVDPYRVLNGSVEFKAKSEKIQKEIDKRVARVESLKAEHDKKTEELKNMGSTAVESALENKQKDIAVTRNNIEIENAALKQYVQNASDRAQMEFLQTVQEALAEYSELNGIDIVVGNGLLFVSSRADITENIIAFMNEKFEAKGKKAVPAAATPAAKK